MSAQTLTASAQVGATSAQTRIVSAQARIAIGSRGDFELIRNSLDGNFYLSNDIDFGTDPFEPIGSVEAPFTGILEGRGHSIVNLRVESICDQVPITFANLAAFVSETNRGLFGVTDGAMLMDVQLRNVHVAGYLMVGALIGRGQDTVVERCSATGSAIGIEQVGGLIGFLGNCDLLQCWTDVSVDLCPLPEPFFAGKWVGGLVGHAHPFRLPGRADDSTGDGSTLLHCYTLGDTRGRQVVGGVIGNLHGSLADHCFAIGNVEATQGHSGGFAGYLQIEPGVGDSPVPVQTIAIHCHAHGQVTAIDNPFFMGGLVDGRAATNAGFIGYVEGGLDPATGLPMERIERCSARGETETVEEETGLSIPTAGFVGFTETETVLRRCFANGAVRAPFHNSVGGFVGWGEGLITDSTAHGDVLAYNRVGGFGGQVAGTVGGTGDGPPGPFDGSFERCASFGDVRATQPEFDVGGVGGFVGYLFAFVRIEDCEGRGAVHTSDGWGGGFVGHIASSVIERSASFGPVFSAGPDSGGFAARTRLVDGTAIRDCYSHSTVIAAEASSIGGFIGSGDSSAEVERCYAKGLVVSDAPSVGGFVGNFGPLSFSNCYWDLEASGQSEPMGSGLTPATTQQMQQSTTYIGWDFAETWSVQEGNAYPLLAASP